MSHEEHPAESKGHESGIKTPRQLLITVILAFVVPIVIIMMLVNLVGTGIKTGAGSDGQTAEAIATRIQPVAGFKLVDANAPKAVETSQQAAAASAATSATPTEAPKVAATEPAPAAAAPTEAPQAVADTAASSVVGKKIYDSVCFACHASGVAGAPKFADKEAWAPYIKTGLDEMVKNAIHGIRAMPPRGGSQASDEEMRAAVEYIMHAAQ